MSGVQLVKLDRATEIVTPRRSATPPSIGAVDRGGDAAFKPIYAISGFQGFQDLAMLDVTVLKDNRTRLYVYNDTASLDDQGLYRLDSANVPASRLVTSDGAGRLTNTSAWIKLTSNDTSQPGSTSRRLCSTQCFYDLVVALPEREPDTVVLGGVATPTFGQPTIRSTDAGVSFSAFGIDARGTGSHVDVRAVVFHPREPRTAWVGSDGGIVRNDGNFKDVTSRCAPDFNNAPQCQTIFRNVPCGSTG